MNGFAAFQHESEKNWLKVGLNERGQSAEGFLLFSRLIGYKQENGSKVSFLLGTEDTKNVCVLAACSVSKQELALTVVHLKDPENEEKWKRSDFGTFACDKRADSKLNFQLLHHEIKIQSKPFSYEIFACDPSHSDSTGILKSSREDINVGEAMQSSAVGLGPKGTVLAFEFDSNQKYFGTGEDFGPFEKTSQVRRIVNADALGNHGGFVYQNAPFLFSNTGLAFELMGNTPCVFDVGGTRQGILMVAQPSDHFELKVFQTGTVRQSVLAVRSGQRPCAEVPDWAFGLWLSRCFYQDETEVRNVLAGARSRGIPVGTINLDARCWMRAAHRTDFVPDAARFVDFFKLISDIREMGIDVCLWENPYVSSISELYAEGTRLGFFAKTSKGEVYPYQWVPSGLPGFPQPPQSGLVDFTIPAAREWWDAKHRPFLQAGVRCFKTDFGEEIPFDMVFANGANGFEMRNAYSDLYNETVFAAVRRVHQSEAIIWARSGYRNVQSYPVKWAGDGQTNWRSLRATLRAGLSQAFGGALFWSHDVGGFYGAPPTPELFLRWSQCAFFGSHVRLHGTTPREPWCYGSECLQLFQKSLQVRTLLKDYFLGSFRRCVESRESFMRPLAFEHPESIAACNIDDAFYAGSDLLIAPFLNETGGRNVWLPSGRWIDMRCGQEYSGDQQINTSRTAFMPVFYRAESPFRELFESATRLIATQMGGAAQMQPLAEVNPQ